MSAMNMPDRYERQTILPEIGAAGQRRLQAARVLCIGAGGLGCAALPYLTGAGVGRLTILDDDRVETGNLQRQVLFRETDVGRSKAEAAAERLRARNGGIEIVARHERLDSGNVQALFEDHDVIVDGSDNFDTKFLLGDASVKFGVPVVYGSVVGFDAQVTVLDPDHGPCLRCLFPYPPDGWVPNCAEAGVLGPLVGMAGCIQATEALKVLINENGSEALASLVGRIWTVDGRDMSTRSLKVARRRDCATCGGRPEAIVLPRPERHGALNISPARASDLDGARFVDIREPDEWRAGRIPGAINLPLSRLVSGERPDVDDDALCVLYCARGTRGETAARLLVDAGMPNVRNLRGGLAAWPGQRESED